MSREEGESCQQLCKALEGLQVEKQISLDVPTAGLELFLARAEGVGGGG